MTVPTLSPEIDPRYALDDPADQGGSFTRDPMHFPLPLSPLFQSVHPQVFGPGYRTAAREIGIPIADFQHRFRNNYLYERVVPVIPGSDEEARELDERAEAGMRLAMGQMGRRWQDEHLPRLRELLASLAEARELDPAAPLDPARVDALLAICVEGWTIHFRIAFPMLVGIQLFEEFLADVAGPEADAHAMLTGLLTESVANGIAITDLAAAARDLGLGGAGAGNTDRPSSTSALQAAPEGQELLDRIDAYLADYGLTQSLFDFVVPTWQEDPAPLYATLRSYLETGGDNRAAHDEQARRAEEAATAMRERLASYPEPMRQQFEAHAGHGANGQLPAGRAQFLHRSTAAQLGTAGVPGAWPSARASWRSRSGRGHFLPASRRGPGAARRRAVGRARHRDRTASVLRGSLTGGTPAVPRCATQSGPPPDNPVTRAMSRFFGWAPPAADDSGPMRGYPGSRGQTEAPAFVARSLDEASAIPVGHVLVTVTTTPSWTPLFGIASAVVTETGGPLSHCAIVAREYGLPAVVGVRGATTRIVTGQLIQVDGTGGEVTLLS